MSNSLSYKEIYNLRKEDSLLIGINIHQSTPRLARVSYKTLLSLLSTDLSTGSGAVESVNAKIGIVTLNALEIPFDGTLTGLPANVQGAIDNLFANKNVFTSGLIDDGSGTITWGGALDYYTQITNKDGVSFLVDGVVELSIMKDNITLQTSFIGGLILPRSEAVANNVERVEGMIKFDTNSQQLMVVKNGVWHNITTTIV